MLIYEIIQIKNEILLGSEQLHILYIKIKSPPWGCHHSDTPWRAFPFSVYFTFNRFLNPGIPNIILLTGLFDIRAAVIEVIQTDFISLIYQQVLTLFMIWFMIQNPVAPINLL